MGRFDVSRRALWEVARNQHGVVTREQAVECGYAERQVERMVGRGEATRLYRGVYLLGPTLSAHGQLLAAVYACGPSAAISHQPGACLIKLLPLPALFETVDVTVTSGCCQSQPGIRVHRSTTLQPFERRERDGITVTSPLRTILDLASCASDRDLEMAIAEAFALGMVNKGMLERAISQARGRRGVGRIRELIGGGRRPSVTRSKPERLLRRLLLAAGIDDFETNARIGLWEVDFYFRAIGLAVEVDAYATHSSPWAFERDRRKTAALEDRGLTVHRVTDGQIDDGPTLVVAGIRNRIRRLSAE